MAAEPAIVEIEIADAPDAWRAAGFTVEDDHARVGAIIVRFVGPSEKRRTRSWTWSGLSGDGPIDGLATHHGSPATGTAPTHANGSTILDHVVVVTPRVDRSIAAFASRGLAVRRTRHTDQYGAPFRQVFFRAGETIVEMIGPDEPGDDDRAAHFFGLAFTVADLDAAAALLGPGLGRIKDAVQPGRRIATLRHESFGVSVPIALMSE